MGEAKVPAANTTVVRVEKRISIPGVNVRVGYRIGSRSQILEVSSKDRRIRKECKLPQEDFVFGVSDRTSRVETGVFGLSMGRGRFGWRNFEQTNELLCTLKRMEVRKA